MKNKKLLLAPALLILAAVISLPLLVAAAPSFPPPTGLTDATFSTVKTGKLDVEVSSGGAAEIGSSTTSATGLYAIALGALAQASNSSAIALGYAANAAAQASVAIGANAATTTYATYATAIGYESDATGSQSTAVGPWAQALTTGSLAVGPSAIASINNYAIAIGHNSTSSGLESLAMGNAAQATGNSSYAIGYSPVARSAGSFALGYQSQTGAAANYSLAMGYQAQANAHNATAIGQNAVASELWSTSLGYNTLAEGRLSTAIGNGTTARPYASVVVGSYNVVSGNTTAWANADPIFVVGNGLSAASPSNALTVLKNGNVGIGQTNPTNMLEVNGSARINNQLEVYGTSGIVNSYSDYGVVIADADGLDVRAGIGNYTAGSVPVAIRDDHGLDIANYAGTVGLQLGPTATIRNPTGGNIDIFGSLVSNTGDLTINDNLAVWGWLYGGNTRLSGTIANASSNYSGRLYLNDDIEVTGSTYLDGYTNIGGNLNLTGYLYNSSSTLSFQDSVDVTGYVQATSGIYGNYLSSTGGVYGGTYVYSAGNIYTSSGTIYTSSGNIGAGTSSPSARVHGTGSTYGVWGSGSTMGGKFEDSDSGSYANVAYGASGIAAYGNTQGGYFYDNDSAIYTRIAYGTYSVYGSGVVRAVGIQNDSDERLKTKIENISGALDKVMKLRGVTFEWKNPNLAKGKKIGFIAQEVEKVVPELVVPPVEANDGEGDELGGPEKYYALEYSNFTALLTTALQELKHEKDSEVAELKAELKELKALVCELKPTAVQCAQ